MRRAAVVPIGASTFASGPAGEGNGVVTYGEAFTVQPFGNIVQTVTLTGAQSDAVLEQQWSLTRPTAIAQISNGFSYTMRPTNFSTAHPSPRRPRTV